MLKEEESGLAFWSKRKLDVVDLVVPKRKRRRKRKRKRGRERRQTLGAVSSSAWKICRSFWNLGFGSTVTAVMYFAR